MVREKELDRERQKKDAEEQIGKNTRAAEMKAQMKIHVAREKAEEHARQILKEAEATAQKIIESAQSTAASHSTSSDHSSSSSSSSSNEYYKATGRRLNVKNSILLKAKQISLDESKLGLAPPMSVDTSLIRQGHKLVKVSDAMHYDFEDQHEQDCKLPVCKGGK